MVTPSKYIWFKMFGADWLSDGNLTACQLATRGVWIDAVCRMYELRTGRLTGTAEQLSRLLRASPADILTAAADLDATKTADVRYSNDTVTLSCRRLAKLFNSRESNRLRVSRHREKRACNGTESRNQKQKLETTPIAPTGGTVDAGDLNPLGPGVTAVPHVEFVNAWNALGPPFPRVEQWSDKRRKALKARWADGFWREHWQQALAAMSRSRWHRGGNDRQWVAGVDYLLRPDSVAKLLERGGGVRD